jgi:hypothetical protein
MILAYLLLLTGLTISGVAIYYSVVGLTAIFSAAAIPIIIMGSALEVGKLVCASWLKANWERAPGFMRYYMTTAVIVLMLITSMGIFGFLSKAHNDQSLVTGDVASKIAIYDEKIKTERENIDANRKALKQLDESVDQVMGRSQDEKGAEKAVAIRKAQQKERGRLAQDITDSQKKIAALNEERAPIAAEVRKVEAEVGPIKYIAAFIYGANPDSSLLEKAVTWIIILIVIVFDPLAVIMLLASQMTFSWKKEEKETAILDLDRDIGEPPIAKEKAAYEADDGPLSEEYIEAFRKSVPIPPGNTVTTSSLFTESDSALDPCYKCGTPLIIAPGIGPFCPNKLCDVVDATSGETIEFIDYNPTEISPADKQARRNWKEANPGKSLKAHQRLHDAGHIEELPWNTPDYHPDYQDQLELAADNELPQSTGNMRGFGSEFPGSAVKGDMYLRTDRLPSALYKFNGNTWIEVDKNVSDSYVYDEAYIDHLIEKIDSGEYDPELLSESEKDGIANRLNTKST